MFQLHLSNLIAVMWEGVYPEELSTNESKQSV